MVRQASATAEGSARPDRAIVVPIPTPLMARVLADRRVRTLVDDAGQLFRVHPEFARALMAAARAERVRQIAALREARGVRS